MFGFVCKYVIVVYCTVIGCLTIISIFNVKIYWWSLQYWPNLPQVELRVWVYKCPLLWIYIDAETRLEALHGVSLSDKTRPSFIHDKYGRCCYMASFVCTLLFYQLELFSDYIWLHVSAAIPTWPAWGWYGGRQGRVARGTLQCIANPTQLRNYNLVVVMKNRVNLSIIETWMVMITWYDEYHRVGYYTQESLIANPKNMYSNDQVRYSGKERAKEC